MLGLFLFIAIGLVVGGIADMFAQGGRLGKGGHIAVAVAGSLVGGYLFQQFGNRLVGDGPDMPLSFVAAFVVSVVLLLIVSLILKR